MKKLGLFLLTAITLGACDSYKTPAPAPSLPTRTELLTAKNWRITAATTTRVVGSAAPVVTDDFAATRACARDDFSRFETNKVLFVDEGASKCDPNDPQLRRFSWAFNATETQLLITSLTGQPLETNDIVELTATTLRLRTTTTGGTTTTTINVTFTAF